MAAQVEDERTVGIPSRQLADALSYAAGRTATALGAGIAPDPVDLDVIATNARALIARARVAHPDVEWDDTTPAPTTTVLQLDPAARSKPSRDVSVGIAGPREAVPLPPLEEVGRLPENLRGAPPITRWEQLAGVLGEDWVKMAKDATGSDGPDPDRPRPNQEQPSRDASTPARQRPPKKKDTGQLLRLTRKKALALLDAAELVKDPDHRDNHTWHLVAADGTVIGHVAPSYSGASRSGRNGWHGWAHGMSRNQERHPTRDAAKVAAAGSWLRIVAAKPRR